MITHEIHVFMLTPAKDGNGGLAKPFRLEKATLELGVRSADNKPMAKITNRAGEVMHLEAEAVHALNALLNDLLSKGKLQ